MAVLNSVGNSLTGLTGTGQFVGDTSPTLVTPDIGTPSAGTLTNATGLPIATGVSGLDTGVATFLGTASSANLASAVTDETGSGSLVFATSPTLVTPSLGDATGTQLDIDNLRLDGNTLSSTDTAGNIVITPDTTGDLVLDGVNWPQADGSANTILTTDGVGQLSWTTASFPASAGSTGTVLRSDGNDWVASTSTFADTYSASAILFSNGASAVQGLATANDGLLVTSGTGVPSIGNAIGADITVNGITVGHGNLTTPSNTAVGTSALTSVTSATLCTGIGSTAGQAITTGSGNTAIGYSTLVSVDTGGSNVALGERAGRDTAGGIAATLTTGDDNTFLGTHATTDSASGSGTLAMGKDAIANSATGATSGDDGPSIAIGSSGTPVGFRGDATIYPSAGTSAGYWRVKINGTFYKILLMDDT